MEGKGEVKRVLKIELDLGIFQVQDAHELFKERNSLYSCMRFFRGDVQVGDTYLGPLA